MQKVLLTEKEVESIYGIPIKTLQKWRVYGTNLQFVKIGRRVYYRVEDINAHIEANTFRSTSEHSYKMNLNNIKIPYVVKGS